MYKYGIWNTEKDSVIGVVSRSEPYDYNMFPILKDTTVRLDNDTANPGLGWHKEKGHWVVPQKCEWYEIPKWNAKTKKYDLFLNDVEVQHAQDNIKVKVGVMQFSDLKTKMYKRIDDVTDGIIAEGFPFDDKMFSLSANAQLNWTALKIFSDNKQLAFPFTVSTMDNSSYDLTQNNAGIFFNGIFSYVSKLIEVARGFKDDIAAETDVDKVYYWHDPRLDTGYSLF